MPWMFVGELGLGGVPSIAGLWVLGLGILAAVLALLSVITRKNSRHPLLLVGLAAFGRNETGGPSPAASRSSGTRSTTSSRCRHEGHTAPPGPVPITGHGAGGTG